MKARCSGPAAPHWTNLKGFRGNMSRKDFKNNSAGGNQRFKTESSMN